MSLPANVIAGSTISNISTPIINLRVRVSESALPSLEGSSSRFRAAY